MEAFSAKFFALIYGQVSGSETGKTGLPTGTGQVQKVLPGDLPVQNGVALWSVRQEGVDGAVVMVKGRAEIICAEGLGCHENEPTGPH
ncbi:MAG: hypothetical protein AAFQ10_12625 [Pseudomonadota bacterium]